MFDRWSDLETLRLSLTNLQEMIAILQAQANRLHEAIEFRLDPLAHEVEELRQRYDVDCDS